MTDLKKNKTIIAILTLTLLLFSVLPASAKLSHQDAKDVWAKVAKATDLTSLPFDIKEEKVPNAWVTNGKSVTVTTGLLDILDSQSELYGVFAHEAGHAKLGHYESTVKRNTGVGLAAAILGSVLGSNIGSVAVGVGANLAVAGWSREQEVAADDYSVHLSFNQGEDPVGLYAAMQKLSAYGGKTEPSGFNSHPPDDRRLLHIKNEILSLNPNAKFPDPPVVNKEQQQTQGTPAQTQPAETKPVEVKPASKPVEAPKQDTQTDNTNARWEALKRETLSKDEAGKN